MFVKFEWCSSSLHSYTNSMQVHSHKHMHTHRHKETHAVCAMSVNFKEGLLAFTSPLVHIKYFYSAFYIHRNTCRCTCVLCPVDQLQETITYIPLSSISCKQCMQVHRHIHPFSNAEVYLLSSKTNKIRVTVTILISEMKVEGGMLMIE